MKLCHLFWPSVVVVDRPGEFFKALVMTSSTVMTTSTAMTSSTAMTTSMVVTMKTDDQFDGC